MAALVAPVRSLYVGVLVLLAFRLREACGKCVYPSSLPEYCDMITYKVSSLGTGPARCFGPRLRRWMPKV